MTTVVDVIADGLARAGTARVFATTSGRGADPIVEAMRRVEMPVSQVPRADIACVMAGVSGALAGAPGAAVIGDDLREAIHGLAHAFSTREPAVAISSGAGSTDVSALAGVTKATLVAGAGSAAHWIAHACQLSMKEPWGPVHLELPPGVVSAAALPVATSCRPAPLAAPDATALDAATRLLEAAERPVVVAGRLCRTEADAAWVRAFAEARPAPVLVTSGARGVLPDPHPLVIGTLGATGAERTILDSADLVVAIALDPAEVSAHSWRPGMTVLELTPVASDEPGTAAARIVGDVGLILEELAPRLRDRRSAEWDVARLHALKQAASEPPTDATALASFRVVAAARRLTPAGTIAVFERHAPWAAASRAWHAVAPGECVVGDGFAVAAAAAAQIARPERRVVCFMDASALPAARPQLETVAALGLPLVIVAPGAAASILPAPLRAFTAASSVAFASTLEAALAARVPALVAARDG
jgi:acetolactate synthase-1/2/3 large subunit